MTAKGLKLLPLLLLATLALAQYDYEYNYGYDFYDTGFDGEPGAGATCKRSRARCSEPWSAARSLKPRAQLRRQFNKDSVLPQAAWRQPA